MKKRLISLLIVLLLVLSAFVYAQGNETDSRKEGRWRGKGLKKILSVYYLPK